MDDHERAMWQRMLDRTIEFDGGTDALGKLVADLRGLFAEADPKDPKIRAEFEAYWAPIDGEHELRTEPWSRPDLVSEERLAQVLDDFRSWVSSVLTGHSPQS